jgi:hypothetical protein
MLTILRRRVAARAAAWAATGQGCRGAQQVVGDGSAQHPG